MGELRPEPSVSERCGEGVLGRGKREGRNRRQCTWCVDDGVGYRSDWSMMTRAEVERR